MTKDILNLNNFSGLSVKKARLFKGYSMEELAKKISVTQQMLSKYENGRSVPTYDVLQELSTLLGFPVSYFYTNSVPADMSEGFFRKGSNVPKKNKQKVAEKATYFSDILKEISTLVLLPQYHDPVEIKRTKEYQTIERSYLEKTANAIRNKFNFGYGPLLNLTAFLESLGIRIIFTNLESEKIDAYTIIIDGNPIILINSTRISSSRIRFNLAHEFAHILFHREYLKKYENGGKFMTIEQEANYFAGCFLVTEQGLLEDLASVNLQHFIALKSDWHVSIAAIIFRANECGFISDSHTLHLRQQISRNGWRTNEPLDDSIPIEKPQIVTEALEIYSRKSNSDALIVIASKLRLFPSFLSELLFGQAFENKREKKVLKLI